MYEEKLMDTCVETDRPTEMSVLENASHQVALSVEAVVMALSQLEDKLSPIRESVPEAPALKEVEKNQRDRFGSSRHLVFLSQTDEILRTTRERIDRLRNSLEI